MSTRFHLTSRPWLQAIVAAFGLLAARVGGDALCQSSSAQTSTPAFEVYLPRGYDRARHWPILFVLDPRGRASMALDLFKPAAERLGYIVMSSHQSLSDSDDRDVNVRAFNAMLDAAQSDYSIDLHRLYIAGFSGTARAAVTFAVELRGRVAGVVAVGAATSGAELAFSRDSTFAYFAATGETDFNHEEVLGATERLRGAQIPYRLNIFPGPHSWPPADVCASAIEWFTLRAMRGGLMAADSSWMSVHLDSELTTAKASESAGRLGEAVRLYAAIGRDYPKSPRTEAAQSASNGVERRPEYVAWLRKTNELAERDRRQAKELPEVLRWFRTARQIPSADALWDRLDLEALRRQASQGDSLAAPAASRIIARTLALLTFYEPRAMIAAGDYARARRMLEVAARYAPLRGEGCALLEEVNKHDPPREPSAKLASCS